MLKIGMWSGPRNLSTAMMYSFAGRSDCAVVDEPFYAAFLDQSGLDHPMREEILAAGERDPDKVIATCCGPNPVGARVWYQKHMTQHMVSGIDRSWVRGLTNVFLVRDPSRVIASYHQKRQDPCLADIGIVEQAALFDEVRASGEEAPIVIDSDAVLSAPEKTLRGLCGALEIPFEQGMLAWEAGPKSYDGIWAPHWYDSVWKSTGFGRPYVGEPVVPGHLQAVCDEAKEYYEYMKANARRVEG